MKMLLKTLKNQREKLLNDETVPIYTIGKSADKLKDTSDFIGTLNGWSLIHRSLL